MPLTNKRVFFAREYQAADLRWIRDVTYKQESVLLGNTNSFVGLEVEYIISCKVRFLKTGTHFKVLFYKIASSWHVRAEIVEKRPEKWGGGGRHE